MVKSLVLGLLLLSSHAYVSPPALRRSWFSLNQVTTSSEKDYPWQKDMDTFLNIDTPCSSRREVARNLLGKWQDITRDFVQAVQDRDVNVVAPKDLEYGKSIAGIQSVQKQIVSDILPDILNKGLPKLFEEGPKAIQSVISNPDDIISRGRELADSLKELTEDASRLQSTVEDIRREARNVVRRTPEGLETPAYQVISKNDIYEIRKYSAYSVCGTKMPVESDGQEKPSMPGQSFNALAGYLFGENSLDEKMSMTTPVIMVDGNMEFVLPSPITADTAPMPKTQDIFLKDVPTETVAVVEFTGFATDGEISRQRALLEDALLADGVMYDNLTFKVFQYNPPYTLPWLRRNEVCLKVFVDGGFDATPPAEPEFSTSPEAGD